MHAYRDAIRDSNDARVVEYAAILYPGPEFRLHDDIEALSALPGSTALREAVSRRAREWLA
jgi:hypothetical protein